MHKILSLFKIIFVITGCQSNNITPDKMPTEESIQKMNNQKIEDRTNLEYCMGKFEPSEDERFKIIDKKYADRTGMYLRKEAYDAFIKMYNAAKADGITLVIRSATRNFNYQKGIWERKWTGKTKLSDGINAAKDIVKDYERAVKIMNYSAMPGASRHHWGTDIDLNSFTNSYFEKGEGLRVYQWLTERAHSFGYCQPYTPKETGRTGYEEEKWHWSYIPLSKPLTAFMKLHMHDHHLNEFLGHKTASDIGVVKNYILGIDESCK